MIGAMVRWLALAGMALMFGLGLAAPASAHEVRPGYLQIREAAPDTFDLLWKTPAQGQMRLAIDVVLPSNCAVVTEPSAVLLEGSVLARWRAKCVGGLVGKEIAVNRLDATLTDVIVRYEPVNGSSKMLHLTPDRPSGVLPAKQSLGAVAATYFGLGVSHILLGFDHLMFVLGLLLLVPNFKRLLGAITAFTLAHSLTLAGTTLGYLSLPPPPVEATIALSIMFVASEIVRTRAGKSSLTAQLPWLASFTFGLLHGFGFAGALREIGLPQDAIGPALLFFNVGVEAGQLLFIGAVLTVMALWRRFAPPTPVWAWRVPVYGIGATAAFWFVERTAGIVGL